MWGFESSQVARLHPIVQEGDPVVESPEETLECWNYLFLPRMCTEVLRQPEMDVRLRESIDTAPSEPHRAARCRVGSQEVWDSLRRMARKPPDDPSDVVARIVEDRRLYDEWHQREQTRRTSMTTAQTEGTKPAAAPAAPKTVAGFAPTATIAFGADKEGKAYNTSDANPKRAGSKSHDLFAKYKAGMTVEQAQAAGIPAAALKWDSEHGFIKIS